LDTPRGNPPRGSEDAPDNASPTRAPGTIDRISKKNSDSTIRPNGRFSVYSRPTETIS
jgi:hypothetical protein